MNQSLIPQAMAWKYGAKCSKNQQGDGIDKWEHETLSKPNQLQLIKDLSEYEAFLRSREYIAKRAAEYPSIEDQLDALMKGGKDLEDMRARVLAVKAKFPKPA